MGAAKRVSLEVAGWTLVVVGIIAIPLPGPGLLILFAGVALLAKRYEWARRRLAPLKYRALKGAAESVENRSRILIAIGGATFLAACGVLWILDPPAPGWWVLPSWTWLPGGLATGITQIVSALAALALVRYAYVRFHGNPQAVAQLEHDRDRADAEFVAGD